MNVIMDEAPCWPGSGRMVYAALRSLPAVMHNHPHPRPAPPRGRKEGGKKYYILGLLFVVCYSYSFTNKQTYQEFVPGKQVYYIDNCLQLIYCTTK